MIPHASENAGVGAQAGELPQTCLQRIAPRGDQIACDQRQVRAQLVGAIDDPRQILLAQESAQMDVAQVQQAQPIQAVGEIGDGDLHFPHLEIQAFDERAVTHNRERRGQQRSSRGVEQAAARGIESWDPRPVRQAQRTRAVGQVSGSGAEEPDLRHATGDLRTGLPAACTS